MQQKTPASGISKPPSEPTTKRNVGDAERERQGPKERGVWQRQVQRERPPEGRTSTDRIVNESSDDSFPASDAPSWSPTTAGSPCPDPSKDDEEGVSKE